MKSGEFKRAFAPDYKTSGNVIVTGVCHVTGKEHSITVKHEELEAWLQSQLDPMKYIQDLMPSASADDREFLISSTSPEGWAILFPSGDADAFPESVSRDSWGGESVARDPLEQLPDGLVPLEELDDRMLRAIANFQGGNDLARMEAVAAQAILDRRQEDLARQAVIDHRA